MYILPEDNVSKRYIKGCVEKLHSYGFLLSAGLPVLKSVIITREELDQWEGSKEKKIRTYLGNDYGMIRYLYKRPCHAVKNGGKIILISMDNIMKEMETDADLWLLEPSKRENNSYCFNICLNRQLENLHIEILGRGFDISDINKGKLFPHEWIDIPYPIRFGTYGDWWKWAKFYFCSQNAYEESVRIRKERLDKFKISSKGIFDICYKPLPMEILCQIFGWVQTIEKLGFNNNSDFYNLSCSCEENGRIIFWDIQTPKGKANAYIENRKDFEKDRHYE